MDHSLKERLEKDIAEVLISPGREILEIIVKHELAHLAARNPTFDELATSAKETLVRLHELIEDQADVFRHVLAKFAEYAEILEHIAESVNAMDSKLLTDCICHLNEFIEINGE